MTKSCINHISIVFTFSRGCVTNVYIWDIFCKQTNGMHMSFVLSSQLAKNHDIYHLSRHLIFCSDEKWWCVCISIATQYCIILFSCCNGFELVSVSKTTMSSDYHVTHDHNKTFPVSLTMIMTRQKLQWLRSESNYCFKPGTYGNKRSTSLEYMYTICMREVRFWMMIVSYYFPSRSTGKLNIWLIDNDQSTSHLQVKKHE